MKTTKTIKVLKNFGLNGKNLLPGSQLDVDPEQFGDTFDDCVEAGLIEVLAGPPPAPRRGKLADAPEVPDAPGD